MKDFFYNYIKLSKKYLLKYESNIYIGFVLSILYLVLSIGVPLFSKYLIDNVILKNDLNFLKKYFLVAIIFWIGYSLINFFYNYILIKLNQNVNTDIKMDFFNHVIKLPLINFFHNESGILFYRLFEESENIGANISLMPFTIILNLILIVIVTGIMFILNWQISIFLIFLYFIQTYIFFKIKKKIYNNELTIRSKNEILRSKVLDKLKNIFLIKINLQESYEIDTFNKKAKDILGTNIKRLTLIKFFEVLTFSIMNLWLFGLLWIGAYMIILNKFTLGGLVAFINFATLLFQPIQIIIMQFVQLEETNVNLKRFLEIMNLRKEKGVCDVTKPIKIKGDIKFENVDYSYFSYKKILNNISFSIEPGTKVGIIGASGVGKTTLCNLIFGFYYPTKGNIYFDNTEIHDLNLNSVRKNIGYVVQNNFTFNGTILENLKYGNPDATDEIIEDAIKKAHIYNLIDSLPEKYNTKIGESNIRLSHGENQRIAIARVIIQNPQIIIWDEATSFVDIETEEKILNSFLNVTKDKTTIIVSHKPSFLRYVDRVFELSKDGILVEKNNIN